MKNLVSITATLLILSATTTLRAQQDKGPQPTKDSIVYKGVSDQACAIEVQFGSYGSGIDGKTYDKVINLLATKKIEYTSKNIGREGETRLCLPLKGMSTRQRNKLAAQLKNIARKGYLTSLSIR